MTYAAFYILGYLSAVVTFISVAAICAAVVGCRKNEREWK